MKDGFDLMDIRSHHSARGLPPAATENRKILREMMEKCGFNAYEQEWWHYTLKQEPYANHYFDFPVA